MTREEWLTKAAHRLRPKFGAAGHAVPDACRYTCGFPSKSALSRKRRRIGECWDKGSSQDNTFEISVSPVLDDPAEVLAVLVHEMVHAAVGLDCGHKGPFRQCALALGLEGKMTATVAGKALHAELVALAGELGPYPHARLEGGRSNGPPKQTTRLLKAECPCGYIIRVTRKWMDDAGLPTCPCGGQFVEAA
jgi:hypothetical protein